jgi:phospholipid/cholesterol/gamma-HCH transport system substrate-binding protein
MSSVRNEVKVGAFILTSLLLFAASIFIMGREKQLFSNQVLFVTSFQDVKGLSNGAPVKLGGMKVGRVGEVRFNPDPRKSNISVEVLINSSFANRIRNDALASIATQGLLGDRFLTIAPGNGAQALQPGGLIKADETGDISELAGDVSKIVGKVNRIADSAEQMMEQFRTEGVGSVVEAAKTLNDVFNAVKTENGVLHSLIYSDDLSTSLKRTIKSFDDITESVKTGPGLAHDVFYESEATIKMSSLKNTLSNLEQTSSQLKRISDAVENGNGLAHSLLYDESPGGVDTLITRLNETAQKLQRVATALSEGEGSIGALLMDSSLYNNLVEITDEAKRSFLLRQAIRTTLVE